MTYVRALFYYQQSNGKIERMHRTLKTDAIRKKPPASLDHAQKFVGDFVHDELLSEHRVLDHEPLTRAKEIPSEANGQRRTTRLAQPGSDASDDAPPRVLDPSSNDAEHGLRFRSDSAGTFKTCSCRISQQPCAGGGK